MGRKTLSGKGIKMEGKNRRKEGKRMKKELIEMCYAHVPVSHKEHNHYGLQICTNKKYLNKENVDGHILSTEILI